VLTRGPIYFSRMYKRRKGSSPEVGESDMPLTGQKGAKYAVYRWTERLYLKPSAEDKELVQGKKTSLVDFGRDVNILGKTRDWVMEF